MIAAITGGIGCGKSTAARFFEKRGFRRVDQDALIRERILTLPDVIAAVRERYGPAAITPEGAIDRAEVAKRVFASEEELRWLEGVTHPRLFALCREEFAAGGDISWIVEVPLLFEKALENWFDFTICVACAPGQQLDRLEQRGLPRVLAAQRIARQLPLARKIELADFVLWNEGTPEFLEAEVDRLAHTLRASA